MPKLSKKIKELVTENMRSAIIEASREIILREGLDKLTMDKLAREAGVSAGSIYNYFENKEAIVNGIMEDAFMNMLNTVGEMASKKADPEEKLYKIVKFMLDDFHSVRRLHGAIMRSNSINHKKEFSQKHLMLLDTISRVFKEGQEMRIFRDIEPRMACSAFLGMLREFQIDPGSIYRNCPSEQLAKEITNIFLRGIKKQESKSEK